MAKTNADMEVLATQEEIENTAEKPKRKTRAVKSDVVSATEGEVIPPVVPTEPIRIDVSYVVMDAIMSEVKSGKPVEEAVQVDARVAGLFESHPYLIVRESRNSYFYSLKAGEVPRAACSYDGIWKQPVSYAIVE